jgi:hypothetical protein
MFQFSNFMAPAGKLRVMGNQDQGLVFFFNQVKQQCGNFIPGLDIQIARGLVCQQEFGLDDQGSCDGDSLAFTAAELCWRMVLPVRKTDFFQYVIHAVGDIILL